MPESQLTRETSMAGAGIFGFGVRRIVAPNAGLMTGAGTNTYLVGTREVAVIDPGPNDPRHLRAILEAANGEAANGVVRAILVTHTHRDHSPLAAVLRDCTGARLIGLPPPGDGRQDESFVPDLVPRDGECIRVDGLQLRTIHTPGHASNCICFLLEQARLLFTGDHVLEGVSPVILPPDGRMADYLNSLAKLADLDFERIAPGHGGVLEEGKRLVRELIAHRLAREAKALERLSTLGRATLEQLTLTVYDDVPVERHQWARLSLEAHLLKLLDESRVVRNGRVWSVASR